jgi:protein SCO1/2
MDRAGSSAAPYCLDPRVTAGHSLAPSPLALLASAGLVALVATGTGAIVLQQGSRFSHPRKVGGAFAMSDLDGRPVSQADLLGKPAALFFGFTHCPEVCPTSLFEMSEVLRAMGKDADRVNAYFISVDPERDTSAAMKDYLSSFDPHLKGLTGNPDQIAQVISAYRVYARKVPLKDGDYTMDHTALVYLMDRDGRFVSPFNLKRTPEQAAAELRRYL